MPRLNAKYSSGGLPESLGGDPAYSYTSGATPPVSGTYTVNDPIRQVLVLYGDVSINGSNLPSGGSPYDQQLLSDTAGKGLSQWAANIAAVNDGGVTINMTEMYDVDWDVSTVYNYDAIIFNSSQRIFTTTERDTIQDAMKQGVGLGGWSDSALNGSPGGAIRKDLGTLARNSIFSSVDGNDLFQTAHDQENGNETVVVSSAEAISGGSNLTIEGEGVSPIILAASIPGAYNARSATVQPFTVTGSYTDTTNVTFTGTVTGVALAEILLGRMGLIMDRQIVWNPTAPGSDITEFDNATFMTNFVRWLLKLI